ncbi:STAS/SEC14 domain-containing protein [Ohtaekwangia koreensis]|uniref:SpoIIAA-like n=1 Tax=Ohtaekwangia koreensis TaxID=688867 RepID=A0A1T5KNH0_9BACT|nr:STAS/SEC14 domain-containing protein [Ohtaekwangia koreensis]SKC65213.1 SpoIIAA-like [Ohtaekwangia koreensis]
MNQHPTTIRLHTQEIGTLDYDPSVPCIIATHIGYILDEEFRDFLNLGLKFLIEKKKTHGKIAWLVDASQLEANLSEEWAVRDWNPRALAEGIQHVAFVLPSDVFGKIPVQNYVDLNEQNQSSAKMVTAIFEDIESAKEWLRESLRNF